MRWLDGITDSVGSKRSASRLERRAASFAWTLGDPTEGSPPGSCPWDSPGKNTGVGCHALLQGIFPTQAVSLPDKELCLREALAVCTPPAPEPSAKRPGS